MQNSNVNDLSLKIQKIIFEIQSNTTNKISSKIKPIEDDGLFHICEALRKYTENLITDIDLSCNKIHDIGMKCLASILKNSKKISNLNLAENYVGSLGMKYLSEKLTFNKSLVYLNLNKNYIGSEGAKFLSEGLKGNRYLEILEISSNNIKSEGAKYVFMGLKTNEKLISLNLNYNIIRDEGAKYIYKLLPFNKTLKSLSINYNIIEDEQLLKKIYSVIERNKKINEMKNIENNYSISDEMEKHKKDLDKSCSIKMKDIEDYVNFGFEELKQDESDLIEIEVNKNENKKQDYKNQSFNKIDEEFRKNDVHINVDENLYLKKSENFLHQSQDRFKRKVILTDVENYQLRSSKNLRMSKKEIENEMFYNTEKNKNKFPSTQEKSRRGNFLKKSILQNTKNIFDYPQTEYISKKKRSKSIKNKNLENHTINQSKQKEKKNSKERQSKLHNLYQTYNIFTPNKKLEKIKENSNSIMQKEKYSQLKEIKLEMENIEGGSISNFINPKNIDVDNNNKSLRISVLSLKDDKSFSKKNLIINDENLQNGIFKNLMINKEILKKINQFENTQNYLISSINTIIKEKSSNQANRYSSYDKNNNNSSENKHADFRIETKQQKDTLKKHLKNSRKINLKNYFKDPSQKKTSKKSNENDKISHLEHFRNGKNINKNINESDNNENYISFDNYNNFNDHENNLFMSLNYLKIKNNHIKLLKDSSLSIKFNAIYPIIYKEYSNIKVHNGEYFNENIIIFEFIPKNYQQKLLLYKTITLISYIRNPNILAFYGFYESSDKNMINSTFKISMVYKKISSKYISIKDFLSIINSYKVNSNQNYMNNNNDFSTEKILKLHTNKENKRMKIKIIEKIFDIFIYFEDFFLANNFYNFLNLFDNKTDIIGNKKAISFNLNLSDFFIKINTEKDVTLRYFLNNFNNVLILQELKVNKSKELENENIFIDYQVENLLFINEIFFLNIERINKNKTHKTEKTQLDFLKFMIDVYSNIQFFLLFNLNLVILELFFEIEQIKILNALTKYYYFYNKKFKNDQYFNDLKLEETMNCLVKQFKIFIFEEKKFNRNNKENKEDELLNNKILQFLIYNFKIFEKRNSIDIEFKEKLLIKYLKGYFIEMKIYENL